MSWDSVVCIVPSLQAGHLMNHLISIRGKRFFQSSQISSGIHPGYLSIGWSSKGMKLTSHFTTCVGLLWAVHYFGCMVCTAIIFHRATQISYFENLLMNWVNNGGWYEDKCQLLFVLYQEMLSLPIFAPPFFLEGKRPLFEWGQCLWRWTNSSSSYKYKYKCCKGMPLF